MAKDNSGAAFPCPVDVLGRDMNGGMTLRDWFAGQVLAGKMGIDSIEYLSPDDIAQRCYRQADAMLEARK